METKSLYTKKLGKQVAANAKPYNSERYHVIVSEDSRWAVVADGKKKASKVFSTQIKAIEYAKETAHKGGGQVVVHNTTGEVEDYFSIS